MNGKMIYKMRYCDGITPYILPFEINKKLLYLDLLGSDKIGYALSVKNENTNFHRILAGLLDMHLFYIKQNNTQMCSYINSWSFYHIFRNRFIKVIVEQTFFYTIYFIYYLKRFIPEELYDNIIFKILSKIIKELYILFVEKYCF
jgi:hypothetical protein